MLSDYICVCVFECLCVCVFSDNIDVYVIRPHICMCYHITYSCLLSHHIVYVIMPHMFVIRPHMYMLSHNIYVYVITQHIFHLI